MGHDGGAYAISVCTKHPRRRKEDQNRANEQNNEILSDRLRGEREEGRESREDVLAKARRPFSPLYSVLLPYGPKMLRLVLLKSVLRCT